MQLTFKHRSRCSKAPVMGRLIPEGSRLDRHLAHQLSSSLFTWREIFSMLLPLILDSVFVMLMGALTTAMISSSGQDSVSAVSLIGPLNTMIYAVYSAISAGGTVVVAQYKGAKNPEGMKRAAGQLFLANPLSAILSAVLLVSFADPIIHGLFGSVEPAIMEKAREYLIGVSISSVFLAVYLSGFSVFRGLGETKLCLKLTVLINLLNFLLSLLFINGMHLDILGSVLALNLCRFIGGAAATWMLLRKKSPLRIGREHIFRIDLPILRKFLHIGIPFGMEQVFMNGGTMLVQIFVAKLGTVCVAANAISNSIFSLIQAAPLAVGTLAVTVIGQCYGAGDKALTRRYGKTMVVLGVFVVILSELICLPFLPGLLKLYQAPPETTRLIGQMLAIAMIAMPFGFPISSIMPNTLRATGDAKFSSYFSLLTMWAVRVGMGYAAAVWMGLGLAGVWLTMALEWGVRSLVFWLRYRSDVWLLSPDGNVLQEQ